MKEFWNSRYKNEGIIWSNNPSRSALVANDKFKDFPVKKILILGIGYGRNAEPFIDSGYLVSGIEIADEAIKLLTRSDIDNKIIDVYEGSVLDMPFDDTKYDAIFSYNVLHLFREKERKLIIEKSGEILNPKGLLFFTVISEFDTGFGQGPELEYNTFNKKGKPVHYFTDLDLKDHFRNFKIIESGLINEPENHGSEGEHVHKCRYVFSSLFPI